MNRTVTYSLVQFDVDLCETTGLLAHPLIHVRRSEKSERAKTWMETHG